MYIKVVCAVLSFVVLSGYLQAQAGWLGSIIDSVPGKPAEGVRDYMDIVGIRPDSGRNGDIAKYNAELMAKNPCMRTLATQFYSAIQTESLTDELSIKNFNKPLPNHVALSESAEAVGLKPGWLWKKALELTKGNKTLALQIIGICGHDDMYQTDGYSFPLTETQKSSLIAAASKISPEVKKILIQKIYAQTLKGFVIPPSDEKRKELYQQVEKHLSESFQYSNGLSCPGSRNKMFYPQALGAEADISADLKKRIASIQAPSKGADYLPAKSYHVMGSAYLSCVMLRKGVPGSIAKTVVTSAVGAYRAGRLCEKIRDQKNTLDMEVSPKEALAVAQDMKENGETCNPYPDKKRKDICVFVKKALGVDFLLDKKVSQELLEYNLTRGLARADASSLFLQSWSSVMTNNCEGIQVTSALQKYFKSRAASGTISPCPKGLNKERCENVRKVMDEWAIDFEWSEASQVAGFNFAKENCNRVDSVESLEKQACKISESASEKRVAKPSSVSQ